MLDSLLTMLHYDFMIRAIVVGGLVSLCSALLGTSLVLKRYSMIGDGLSHVGFAALAIAYAMQLTPMSVSIPVCVLAAFFLLQLEESSKIKGDAATAMQRRFGNWSDDGFSHHGDEYGCLQLYVRIHPCHKPFRFALIRGSFRDGGIALHLVLSAYLCGNL